MGTMEGKALEVEEMMKRRKMEVLCVQEMKWKGDRAREMAEGYKMLNAGGDGRSNDVGIIMNVICVYGPQTGRMEAEKEAFREEVERLAGLSDGQTMLCVAGDFNAHISVVEPGDEESIGRFGWGTRNREGRELVEMLRRNGLVVAGTFFQKKESHKITYRSGRHGSK